MGTNFYCKHKIPEHKRKAFIDKVNTLSAKLIEESKKEVSDFEPILYDFKDHIDSEFDTKEIHLGKRSYGWQFLWDYHNGLYFQPTLKSIKEFLSNKDLIIYNEYGEMFTLDQFFNNELKSCLYKDENHTDGSDDSSIIQWHNHYFINDGLRFSKFEDFS